jgi:hypothetical protein
MSGVCKITMAVNPLSYEEVTLDPPVWLSSWDDVELFTDEWERFCRRAADKGVSPLIARFDLNL